MDKQLAKQLMETIRIARLSTATDNYGAPAWGASSTARARIEGYQEQIFNMEGQEVVSQKRIITDSSATERDLIYLPGESTGNDPGWPIARAVIYRTEKGAVDYYLVYL